MFTRIAVPSDAAAIAPIYNQGIEDRSATFETRPRTPDDLGGWFTGSHPVVVVEAKGKILGFAVTFPYSNRDCYRGVAEFSVYVDRASRGRGVGRLAMSALIREARAAGFWKFLSRIFPENLASLQLMRSLDFREVGVYRSHAQLDGVWRDVVIVELLITANISG